MTKNDETHAAVIRRRARRLRLAGVIVLGLGIGGGALIYWLGTRSSDLADDPAMLGFSRANDRQMGILYGKQGALIEDLEDDLKQPGTQAALLAASGVLFAGACFYFAQWLDFDAEDGEC